MEEYFVSLEQALRQGNWREANENTRCLCKDQVPSLAQIRRIDNLWQDYSSDRFGFTPQYQVWKELGGPSLEPWSRHDVIPSTDVFELYTFFYKFGDEVGWRRGGSWVCWPGMPPPGTSPKLFPTLELENRDAYSFPKGCLPFHDVMTGYDEKAFEPRDCWGEHIWWLWAKLLSHVPELRRSEENLASPNKNGG